MANEPQLGSEKIQVCGCLSRGRCNLVGTYHATDDESGEAAKKRMRSLEDKIKKVADANEDLRTEVKSLKKKALASNNEDYGSNESEQGTSDSDQVHDTSRGGNDPLLFSSRRVSALIPIAHVLPQLIPANR